jgi:branched-chain amino acid transport system permease protein
VYRVVINACITGLATGAIYGLIAIGYTVVYNGTRIFNLAQGDLVMVGVMLSYYTLDVVHLSQWLAVPAVLVGTGAISLIEERLVVRPFLKRKDESIGWFIATLAFALLLESVVIRLYGNNPPLPVRSPLPTSAVHIGFIHFTPQQLLAIIVFVAVASGLQFFYRVSWMGQAMRATSADRHLAMMRGIDVNRISQLAFAIAGVGAGVAGYVVAPIVYSDPSIGLNYAIKGFIALALGGFGNMRGAIVGALMLGVAEQVFDVYGPPAYELGVGVVLLVVALVIRPTGLFGALQAREV